MRHVFICVALCVAFSAPAAERAFNWSEFPLDQPPAGFRSAVAGVGKPGEWKVLLDDDVPVPGPRAAGAAAPTRQAVLAQLAADPADEHFPLLIFDGETYGDFKFTTRFKIVRGDVGQMAGIVFRFKDERNFYVLLASALDQRFWFFKVENGVRGLLIGPKVSIAKGEWHEMAVECAGTRIHCLLDGKELIPMVNDPSFSSGRIGFWTKSDSVCHFTDSRITFTPREILAQALVRDALKEYGRLVDLQIFAARPGSTALQVVAGKDEKTIGQAAGKTEQAVIREGIPYYARGKDAQGKGTATVTFPLPDRNGEPIAAVRVVLQALPGQTEDNAVIRAQPVVRLMRPRVRSLEELLQ